MLCGCEDETTPAMQIKPTGDIPIVSIVTSQGKQIEKEWMGAQITVSHMEGQDDVAVHGKVRGRGNATWKYEKKPYRIKLDTEQQLMGFPASRNWVLLAEYTDKSLLRTAFMCEIARAVGMDYVINYQHVEVTIDGEYKGVYLLVEQVERARQRINVAIDGFIIEDDNYYKEEPLWFSTELMSLYYTFKYPNTEDDDIVRGDADYNFISNYMNQLEEALLKIPEDCESYRKYVDIESFAKWFVVAEVTQNWDPNFYYVLRRRTDKLRMLPLWDAEWTMGLALGDNPEKKWYYPPTQPRVDVAVWPTRRYFTYLMQDPAFVSEVHKWLQVLCVGSAAMQSRVMSRSVAIENAQENNFKRWPVLDTYLAAGLIALGSWQAEVDYVFNFFAERLEWMMQTY